MTITPLKGLCGYDNQWQRYQNTWHVLSHVKTL